MEWIERWNRAMDEIELSLTGEIDCERLGRIACCSAYHFQRMFTYLAGVPLGEYVRRRRMSLAAADLQAGIRSSTSRRAMATSRPRRSTGHFGRCMGLRPRQSAREACRSNATPEWFLA